MRNKKYIKTEDLDWTWEVEKKTHKLTLTYKVTGETVVGELNEGRNMRVPLQERKRDLYDSLLDKLEQQVFGEK